MTTDLFTVVNVNSVMTTVHTGYLVRPAASPTEEAEVIRKQHALPWRVAARKKEGNVKCTGLLTSVPAARKPRAHDAKVVALIKRKLAKIEQDIAAHLYQVDLLMGAHFHLTRSLQQLGQRTGGIR